MTIVCEVKALAAQELKVDMDNGTFEGFCAGYGNVDQGGDRLLYGSGKHIADANPLVPIYFGHGWMQNERPIGKSLYFEEREGGLFTKGKMFDTPSGVEVLTGMREGVLGTMSIGWKPVEKKMLKEEGRMVREVSKWDLTEYSILPNGMSMNPNALITAVKSGRVVIMDSEEEQGVQETEGEETKVDLTDEQVAPKDFAALRAFVEKSDPVALLLDEATYLHELTQNLKAEGREDEVQAALKELDSASLILRALCAVKEASLDGGDLLTLIRQTTENIREAGETLRS